MASFLYAIVLCARRDRVADELDGARMVLFGRQDGRIVIDGEAAKRADAGTRFRRAHERDAVRAGREVFCEHGAGALRAQALPRTAVNRDAPPFIRAREVGGEARAREAGAQVDGTLSGAAELFRALDIPAAIVRNGR